MKTPKFEYTIIAGIPADEGGGSEIVGKTTGGILAVKLAEACLEIGRPTMVQAWKHWGTKRSECVFRKSRTGWLP